MILIVIILLFTVVINTGLGVLVFLKRSTFRRVNVVFSLLSWACAGWVLSVMMAYFFKDPFWRILWGKMSFATSGIIGAAFLCFSLLFPREERGLTSSKLFLVGIPSIIFLVLAFTNQIVFSIRHDSPMFNYGPLYPFFSIYLTTYIFLGFLFLISTYRKSIGTWRLQIKYCLLGMFLTAIFALITNLFLPMSGISKFNWLGPSFTMIMVGFITYSIVKHRLMDINIVLKKGTVYFLLTLLLLVPSAILILVTQELFFREINYLFSAIILSLLILVAFFFHQIKPGTEKAVEYLLFKDKYDYRETLGKFSKAMVSILDLQSLSKRIIDTIAQTMGVEKASLFLMNEEKGGYVLQESRNIKMASPTPLLPKGDPIPRYLQKIGEIIVREELTKGANIPEIKSVIDQMSLLEAEASIPLISKGQLIGMINLSHKFNKDIYSHEDIELLTTLAYQTSIAIENARLYEDLKKSKSYMRRTDRLASLGTLTAGLAHEIRNPLVAIKTFTQLLPERIDDEEFRNHFLNIASSEVDRISSLITELLDFARPSDPKLEFEEINTILDGMLLLVSTETRKKQIHIIKNFTSNLPPIKIDREQIKQVFLNILLNSIEATPERGEITVKTRSFAKPGGEPYIQIEFTDTGQGIPAENLEDIFTPFFTTKHKGSGLGLSISHQIIQDHRGYIEVESELNRGTSFFVNLPLDQEHPERRRDDLIDHRDIFDSFERQ